MKKYDVFMTHKMRSVVTVEANDEEEAKAKAYKESFEQENWEEIDTEYDRVDEGEEIEEEGE